MSKVTYKAIKNMPEVNAYIEQGNRVLGALGFTEHSRGHAVKVAETAGNILEIFNIFFHLSFYNFLNVSLA